VALVGALRPELLGAMWFTLARAIELALTPIGLLIAWLASLFPAGPAGPPPTPPPLPTQPAPDPAALAAVQGQLAWIANLVVVTLLVACGLAALLAARLLLANVIGDPRRLRLKSIERDDVVVETSGTPAGEAADVFGWLVRWLHGRLRSRRGPTVPSRHEGGEVDAWTVYQRLLAWAERRGLGRRPAETTGQLATRLANHAPEAAEAVRVVTSTYEWDRYGAVRAKPEELRRMQSACATLESHQTFV
jgi:hypothetical protein